LVFCNEIAILVKIAYTYLLAVVRRFARYLHFNELADIEPETFNSLTSLERL